MAHPTSTDMIESLNTGMRDVLVINNEMKAVYRFLMRVPVDDIELYYGKFLLRFEKALIKIWNSSVSNHWKKFEDKIRQFADEQKVEIDEDGKVVVTDMQLKMVEIRALSRNTIEADARKRKLVTDEQSNVNEKKSKQVFN